MKRYIRCAKNSTVPEIKSEIFKTICSLRHDKTKAIEGKRGFGNYTSASVPVYYMIDSVTDKYVTVTELSWDKYGDMTPLYSYRYSRDDFYDIIEFPVNVISVKEFKNDEGDIEYEKI